MWVVDRLASLFTGLGTARDKSVSATHVHVVRTKVELDAAYRDNWIARKTIDIVPFDMLRAWRSWQADDATVETIEAAEAQLGVRQKLMAAMIRGRLYGGGVILIGDGAPDPAEELVIDRIGRGGIKYLHVLSRYEITAGEINRDPLSEFYGEPVDYEVRSGENAGQRVHPSRVVRFLGAPVPDEALTSDAAWSDSILQAVLDAVDQATSAAQHVAAMLPEAKQDIISVPGLSTWLATEADTAKLTERFSYAARMKSMFGMLLLDGDGKSPEGEVYQQKQLSFDGLPDVVRLFLQIASGAADIPVTRMLGQSPAGLNATGDSDLRNYYDHVAAKQTVELSPATHRLDRVILRHALGDEPKGVWHIWNALYQQTDKEKAEVGKTKSDMFKTLAETKLVPETVLAEGVKGFLINSDLAPGIEAAYDDHGDVLVDPDEEPEQFDPDGNPTEAFAGTENVLPFRRQRGADAAPRTLYVSRKLKNAADLLSWAADQGFKNLYPASELHVTVAYSRTPIDWMKVEESWRGAELKVEAGGPRLVEPLGDKGLIVLLFVAGELSWRWRQIKEAGASWDHEDYQAHVSFAFDADGADLTKVQPYNGPLVFGPEIFAEVTEGWSAAGS
jgi:phage-related protein (TIGR01555 family)